MQPNTKLYPGKYYVYEWLNKDGECLYVGKGTGKRAWNFHRDGGIGQKIKKIGRENITVKLILWAEDLESVLRYERLLIVMRHPFWNITNNGRSHRAMINRYATLEELRFLGVTAPEFPRDE